MTKVKIILPMIFVMVAVFCAGAATGSIYGEYAGFPRVKVLVNGTEIKSDVPGIVLNGRTMLPARAIAEAAGMDVNWNEQTFTASLTNKQQATSNAQLPSNTEKSDNSGNTGKDKYDYYISMITAHDLIVVAWNEAVNDWQFEMMDNNIDLDQIDSYMNTLNSDMPDEYETAYNCVKEMYRVYIDGWDFMTGSTYEEMWMDTSLREDYQQYLKDINEASDTFEKEINDLPSPAANIYDNGSN